jgi:hypothetical protein
MEKNIFIHKLIGLTTEDAIRLIKDNNFISRIAYEDGEHFIITMDICVDRINLEIEEGIVVSAHFG